MFTVSYIVSIVIDHLLDSKFKLLFVNKCNESDTNPANNKYNDMFVKDICKLFKKDMLRLNKSLISNWSNGLKFEYTIAWYSKQFLKEGGN